jgi:L-amino acid N-acyltransferase YncA
MRPSTASSVTVRPANELDLEPIREIYNHAVLHSTCTADYEPRPVAAQREWYEQRVRAGYPVLVAEDVTGVAAERRVVGWSAIGAYHARVGYRFSCEDSVYVAPDRRGQGIGALLLSPLIEAARERGMHAVLAAIDSENEASIRLHQRFGFAEVGRFPQLITKFDRWLDVVYLQLLLT